VDEGIDTGDIIAQREVSFDVKTHTLHSTYKILEEQIVDLFREYWPQIAVGRCGSRRQPDGGSYHKSSDKMLFIPLIEEKGWQTPVASLIGKAHHARIQRGD
jgi:methionyl-tRNA formyltransferase